LNSKRKSAITQGAADISVTSDFIIGFLARASVTSRHAALVRDMDLDQSFSFFTAGDPELPRVTA